MIYLRLQSSPDGPWGYGRTNNSWTSSRLRPRDYSYNNMDELLQDIGRGSESFFRGNELLLTRNGRTFKLLSPTDKQPYPNTIDYTGLNPQHRGMYIEGLFMRTAPMPQSS